MNSVADLLNYKAVPNGFTRSAALLQRKCDCGQHTIASGECTACKEREVMLQRSAITGEPVIPANSLPADLQTANTTRRDELVTRRTEEVRRSGQVTWAPHRRTAGDNLTEHVE